MQRDAKDVFSNFEDEKFSYLIIRRGEKPEKPKVNLEQASPSELSDASFYWARAVRRALRKKKHVILDLCTKRGAIERHVIPKSYGRSVYGDAKELFWGDLWPHPSRKEDEFLDSLEDVTDDEIASDEEVEAEITKENQRGTAKKSTAAVGRGSKQRRSAREIEEEFERELFELENGDFGVEEAEPASSSLTEAIPEKAQGRGRSRGRRGRKGHSNEDTEASSTPS